MHAYRNKFTSNVFHFRPAVVPDLPTLFEVCWFGAPLSDSSATEGRGSLVRGDSAPQLNPYPSADQKPSIYVGQRSLSEVTLKAATPPLKSVRENEWFYMLINRYVSLLVSALISEAVSCCHLA
jgi:hypothetical protein